MNFNEIRHAFETEGRFPKAALAAAMDFSDDFLPLVDALAAKLPAGVYLTPAQANLLLYGVHVLAAARATAFWPAWRNLLRAPLEGLEGTFGDGLPMVVVGVTLSLVGDQVEAVFDFLESQDVSDTVRSALYGVLARLTWEGRIELERTHAFLERVERDDLMEGDDLAWIGWVDAIILLGLSDLSAAMERVFTKDCFKFHREVDFRDNRARLEAADADPADAEQRFSDVGLEAIDDPVRGLTWLATIDALRDEDEAAVAEASLAIPRASFTDEERDWLYGFLESDQAPEDAMVAEELDGFFHALVVGPEAVAASEFMPYVWGGSIAGDEPAWDSDTQRQYALELFEKCYLHIAGGIAAGLTPQPFVEPDDDDRRGTMWATGFMVGLLPNSAAWAPLGAHPQAQRLIRSVMALYRGDSDLLGERITPRVRARILYDLPMLLLAIAEFWLDPSRFDRAEPRRSAKVGRNEQCPCGSGKKYKKCCGAQGDGL